MTIKKLTALCCFLCLSASETLAQVPVKTVPIPQPNSDVVALWLLDEMEGPAGEENWGIYDQSSHHNHGLRQPIGSLAARPRYDLDVPTAAPWNASLDFGASSNSRVEFSDSASLDLTGGFTIEAWVNLNSLSGEQYLVSKRNTTGPPSGYILEWSGGSQEFQFNVGNGSAYEAIASRNFTPTPEQWHHIAAVHDPSGSSSQARLYIDGQLNNSGSVSPVIATNDDPLWLGDWAAGGKPANAKLDQVRISSRVVPPNELGFHQQHRPAQIIFGDNFETYASTGELLSRSGGARNHWKSDAAGSDTTIDLIDSHAHTGDQSLFVQHLNANSSGNRASPFYNLPIAATRDEPIVAVSGWVSFTGAEHVRLFFLNQVWTGNETHYGVTNTNLAGGIQYWGDTKTWRFEDAAGGGSTTVDFSEPIVYQEGLDNWHFYEFVIDYENKEYVSFQFDDKKWDLTGNGILVLPNFFPASVIPVVDHNVRLLELPNPPHPYTAQMALDNPAIEVHGPLRSWNSDEGGDWMNCLNWNPALVPNDPEFKVTFGDVISQSRTVFTDVPVTVNTVTFDSSSTYAVGGIATINLSASSSKDPSITVVEGSHQFQSQVDLNAATSVDVAGGATLTFNNALNLNGNTLTQTGAGTMTINNVLSTGGGVVTLANGTLTGRGVVGGDVENTGGTVAPGSSPGILTIDGDYTQGPRGILSIEISQAAAGEGHDQLIVSGTAILDGQLEVTLLDGFTVKPGDSFVILDSDSVIGDFATFHLPAGMIWDVDTGMLTTVTLPEPAIWHFSLYVLMLVVVRFHQLASSDRLVEHR